MWQNCARTLAARRRCRAGQRTMSGVRVPPSHVYRFHSRNGRVARPRPAPGVVVVGAAAAELVERGEVASAGRRARRTVKRCSLTEPSRPPSALAPLSDISMTIVSSSTPSSLEAVDEPADLRVGVA